MDQKVTTQLVKSLKKKYVSNSNVARNSYLNNGVVLSDFHHVFPIFSIIIIIFLYSSLLCFI